MSLRIRTFLRPAITTQFFSGFFSFWKHRNNSLFQSCYSTLFMQLCWFKLTKIKLSCFGLPSFLFEWYDWTLHKIFYYPCLKLLNQFVGGGGFSLTRTYKTCNSALMKSCFPWTSILVSTAQASDVRRQASDVRRQTPGVRPQASGLRPQIAAMFEIDVQIYRHDKLYLSLSLFRRRNLIWH
jgi:predicted small integral membrane protein